MEEAATLISLLSALVAILAAIYAKRQVKAAVAANQISLHASRMEVLDGLSRFRVHLTARGAAITEEEVWKFAEVVERSDFYFPEPVYKKMNDLHERSLKLMAFHESWQEAKVSEPAKAPSLAKQKQDFMRELRDDCYKVTDEIKKYLRVGAA